ncbi:MAG: hypothetical protein SGPRY_004562 [Prymnesium sp.]
MGTHPNGGTLLPWIRAIVRLHFMRLRLWFILGSLWMLHFVVLNVKLRMRLVVLLAMPLIWLFVYGMLVLSLVLLFISFIMEIILSLIRLIVMLLLSLRFI